MLIGELAKRANVSKDTIRHYVNIGLLNPTRRQVGTRSYREYLSEDLEKLELILLSKKLGFTLSEMKPYIEMFMNENLSDDTAKSAFQQKLVEVEIKISDLQKARDQLKQMIKKYES